MALPRHPTTIENLPCDVFSKIFIRLLAKQLAQMRCVYKSWNALLSESSFVKSHLHHSIQNNDGILLCFHQDYLSKCNSIRARPTHSPDREQTNFIKLPVNPQFQNRRVRVIGSVHGLICFYYESHNNDYDLHIWNPSLSAVVTLPPPCSLPSRDSEDIHFRFGYDPKTDDYKVLRLTKLSRQFNMSPQVEGYSMRKGSWESISQRMGTFPSHLIDIFDQCEIRKDGHDGHLHWLGFNGKINIETIVAFDLGAETFREMPLPECIIGQHDYRWNVVGVLAGKLCLMSYIYAGGCEVWVMDEYGVPKSWVNYHALPEFRGGIFPYGFTSHNEFIFKAYGHLCLYDPIVARTKPFKSMGNGISNILDYVDSLFWVAPMEHEPSNGHISISTSKRDQLLIGLQKAAHQLHFYILLLLICMMLCFIFLSRTA